MTAFPASHVYPLRVYYEDTDAGGIVYHANYLRFAERARTEALRDMGLPHARMIDEFGVMFVVRRVESDYLLAARLDEVSKGHVEHEHRRQHQQPAGHRQDEIADMKYEQVERESPQQHGERDEQRFKGIQQRQQQRLRHQHLQQQLQQLQQYHQWSTGPQP